jgi:hypothetical protein
VTSFSLFGGYCAGHAFGVVLVWMFFPSSHLNSLTIYALSVVVLYLYGFKVFRDPNQTLMRKIRIFAFMNIFAILYYILTKTNFAPNGEE